MSGDTPSLGRQMAKGAAWTVSTRFAIRAIGLVSIVILARLLVPEDFGLVALATLFYGLLEVMGQFSFDVVLIQNQSADRRHYDTAWTLSVLRNLVLAGVLVAGARYAAGFFEEPRLQAILYWLALAAFIEGFANIGVVDFRKELRFHKDFAFMVGAKLGMFAVAVPLAFLWRDYWALVAGIVAGAFAKVALGYLMHPYRPRVSLAKWREIMGFSKWLLLNNILGFIRQRSDTLIIGKIAGAQSLGLYTIAYEISNLATTELLAPIRRALLPGYAKLTADSELLKKGFVDTLAVILLIASPIAAGIGMTADPLVRVVLGKHWLEAIPLIEVLSVYGIISVFAANTFPVYIALARPRIITALFCVGILVVVPLLIWGTNRAGAYGAALAITGTSGLLMFVNLGVAIRIVGTNWVEIFGAVWRTALAVVAMAVAVRGLQVYWPLPMTIFSNALLLAACIVVGGTAYTSVHLGLWRLAGSPKGAEWHVLDALSRRSL